MAGPRRPQDRVALGDLKIDLPWRLQGSDRLERTPITWARVPVIIGNENEELHHGAVAIAAITSCTNTSNPAVMVGRRLVAKKAVERGLDVPPYVKTSLAPGSQVVTAMLDKAALTPYLEALGFHTVGYGCTTCIGNSGPLAAGSGRGGRREQADRCGGALRQPQFRGPHSSAGARIVPGVATAGGGLRAGWECRYRSRYRSARSKTRTASRFI